MPTNNPSSRPVFVPTVNESRLNPGSDGGPVDSWQAYLVEVAYHLRQVVATDPQALDTLITTTRAVWWLRPPVGDVVLVEDFLAAMKRYGFSDEDTAAIYLAFFTRVLGLLIIQTPERFAPTPDSTADLDAYPTLDRLRPWLSVHEDKNTFEEVLDDILTNLERDVKPKPRPRRTLAVSGNRLRAWKT